MLLLLEGIARQGRCIAADPYRAMRYRQRWQELTGSTRQLCDGDLAGCNGWLDIAAPGAIRW
jgi:hypothetical protein